MSDISRGSTLTQSTSRWLDDRPYTKKDFSEWCLLWLPTQCTPIQAYSSIKALNADWWKGQKKFIDGNAEIFEENYAIYQKVIYGEAVLCYCQALSRAAINPDAERMHSGVIPRHGARLSNGSSRRIQWCSESGGLILDQKNRVEGSCLGEKAEVG